MDSRFLFRCSKRIKRDAVVTAILVRHVSECVSLRRGVTYSNLTHSNRTTLKCYYRQFGRIKRGLYIWFLHGRYIDMQDWLGFSVYTALSNASFVHNTERTELTGTNIQALSPGSCTIKTDYRVKLASVFTKFIVIPSAFVC